MVLFSDLTPKYTGSDSCMVSNYSKDFLACLISYLVRLVLADDRPPPCLGLPENAQFRIFAHQSVLLIRPARYETIRLHYRQAFPSPSDVQSSVFVLVSPV